MNLVINLNKERGFTSQDAVTAVKKRFKVRKAGHAGTLDPLATGVLLVCLNEATKVTGYLSDLEKEYLVTAKLGESTDTYDAEGRATRTTEDFDLPPEDVREALGRFVGEIEQVPPMYSAIKKGGTPLYELARKGIEVEREKRKVTISSIAMERYESPVIAFRVTCSKGTYVRSLCNDLGEMLGVGAHMTALVRTKVGGFRVEDAAELEDLPGKASALHSIDAALAHLPSLRLDAERFRRASHGNAVSYAVDELHRESAASFPVSGGAGGYVRLKEPGGRVFGIGKAGPELVRIERLLNL